MGTDLSKFDDKPNPTIAWEVRDYTYLSNLRPLILDNLKGNISVFKKLKLEIRIKKVAKKLGGHIAERYVLLIIMDDLQLCNLPDGPNKVRKKKKTIIWCSEFVEGNLKTIKRYNEYTRPFLYMIATNRNISSPEFI